ncbi:HlyC/CorC family transporter [Aestuariivirga sp.]|uniref:HlyC/CorC family transporter n=1 Tax=Aestuariivirga sp. TaxID=2650926 RepID=UPI003919B59B
MSPEPGWTIAAIFLLLVLSAFLSTLRAALENVSRTRLAELQKKGVSRAGLVLKLLDAEDRSTGGLALGQMLAAILAASAAAFGLAAGEMLPHESLALAAAGLVLFVFFGRVLPAAYGAARAERASIVLAGAGQAALVPLQPPAAWLSAAARVLLRQFGLNGRHDGHSVHEELRETIDLHIKEGTVIKNDRDMLGGILAMQDLEVADIMVHRTKMTMIDRAEDPKEIVAKVLRSGHTRIPVWKDDPDNIIGVLHAKNLFAALQKHGGDAAKIDIEDILLPPWFVPDTRAIPDQLNAFLKRKSHFAIVVDEYGEVQGLVTLEDIIEEIVGDIKDEHDQMASGVRPKPDGSYLVDGAVPIRDLNRAFDWSLPDEEANTIAGLVIHEARMIPEVGQAFIFHGFRFEILKKRRHQITALRMSPLKREANDAEAG